MLCGSSAYAQQSHILVITGVSGDDEHAKKFEKWAATFIDTAKKKEAVPEANITLLSEKNATKANVEKAFTDLAAKAKPTDSVVILLIGHGSFDGRVAAFNLMGPDLYVADYAKLLSKFTTQKIVFVNTTSASGEFLKPLAAPGRVIVTATKTGGERNDTEFPEHFVAAFGDAAADQDRNGHVSIREAFDYAKTKVSQSFQQRGSILTEHAVTRGHRRGPIRFAGIPRQRQFGRGAAGRYQRSGDEGAGRTTRCARAADRRSAFAEGVDGRGPIQQRDGEAADRPRAENQRNSRLASEEEVSRQL